MKLHRFESFQNSVNTKDFHYTLVEACFYSDLLTESERGVLLNENVLDSLKKMGKAALDNAIQLKHKLSDRAKSAFEKIINAAKTLGDFLNGIFNDFKEFMGKNFSELKSKIVKNLLGDEELVKKVKSSKVEKDGLKKDLIEAKGVIEFYTKKFSETLKNSMEKGFETAEDKKLELAESIKYLNNYQYLNEESNLKDKIGKFIHGLESIPPFSFLAKVKEFGEEGANFSIGIMSEITNKLGGPKFALPVIASIIGIIIESKIKGVITSVAASGFAAMALPGIGSLLVALVSYIAMFIAAVIFIDDVFDLGILSHAHH